MSKNYSSSLKITLAYFIFSSMWIYFSDLVINSLIIDIETLQFFQTIKGWIFISLSSLLLYFLTNYYSKNLRIEKNKIANVNEILEKIIENAPIIIFWKDKNGIYLGCNSAFLDLMGLKNKKELLGKRDLDFHVNEKDIFINDDNFVMENKEPKLNYIETVTTKNNGLRVVNTSKVPLLDKNHNVIGILGVTTDITEELKNQKQIKSQEELLIQQSKLAAMGEMIANIAHQWRQPLSVISTLSTGIKLQKELNSLKDEDLLQNMDLINKNVQYLSKTIDDFKNFFKKNNHKNITNSKIILEKTLNLITPRLKNNDIEIILTNNEIEFETFENELIQVLINIINNSIDALENCKTKLIFINIEKQNDCIIFRIYDNAGGIEKSIIDRVFEPYFTTKESNKGTGIGLYMSHEIVTKHLNGKIKADNFNFTYLNNDYCGALFKIIFPFKNFEE